MKALLEQQRQIKHTHLKLHFKYFYAHPTKDCIFLCDLWAPNSFHAQTFNLCSTVVLSKTENTTSYATLAPK